MKNINIQTAVMIALAYVTVSCRTTPPLSPESSLVSEPITLRSWSPFLSCDNNSFILEKVKMERPLIKEDATTERKQELFRATITNPELIEQFNNVMAVSDDIDAPIKRWTITGLKEFGKNHWLTTGQAPSHRESVAQAREPFAYSIRLEESNVVLSVYALANTAQDRIELDPTLLLAANSIGPCLTRQMSMGRRESGNWPLSSSLP